MWNVAVSMSAGTVDRTNDPLIPRPSTMMTEGLEVCREGRGGEGRRCPLSWEPLANMVFKVPLRGCGSAIHSQLVLGWVCIFWWLGAIGMPEHQMYSNAEDTIRVGPSDVVGLDMSPFPRRWASVGGPRPRPCCVRQQTRRLGEWRTLIA